MALTLKAHDALARGIEAGFREVNDDEVRREMNRWLYKIEHALGMRLGTIERGEVMSVPERIKIMLEGDKDGSTHR